MRRLFRTLAAALVGGLIALALGVCGVMVPESMIPDPPFRPPAAGEDWGAFGDSMGGLARLMVEFYFLVAWSLTGALCVGLIVYFRERRDLIARSAASPQGHSSTESVPVRPGEAGSEREPRSV